jgi:hypothetical protein
MHTFEWMPMWAEIFSYFGRIGRFVSRLATKTQMLSVPLCTPCTSAWKLGTWLPAIGMVGGLLLMFLLSWGLSMIDPMLGVVGFFVGMVALLAGAIGGGMMKTKRQLKVIKIEGTQMWLTTLHPSALAAHNR